MKIYDEFYAGDVVLQNGSVLAGTTLAYSTYGKLNEAGDNVIVYPTFFCGTHADNEWLIGEDRALDPRRYFIVVPNLLGNGLSTSPSNSVAFAGARFPSVSIYDNVKLQHRLLTERFGARRVALAVGWSMGAQQVFHWGALYPDYVERIAPFCGSARTSRHNFVFLEGVKAALKADQAFEHGAYRKPPVEGLKAVGRVYAGWGFSQAFYRSECDIKDLGFPSLEAFIEGFWEAFFTKIDANNLLSMLATWQAADISLNTVYQGDFAKALSSIKARAIVMPCETDLYFPPEDSAAEVSSMPNAELRVIPSIWGHSAGALGLNRTDVAFIDQAIKDLLSA
ncbi:alpha/beta fold hydrolase [Methylocapsa sp. S129]|uniref:alpha/beta fold hydrolase n=1 Tax=Methylocapsa sp. S129 TaxID=1641869 RepID=UPI00131D7ADD|nr:alpha/beta fold hydrolase [Methylocapsa sp. S129]